MFSGIRKLFTDIVPLTPSKHGERTKEVPRAGQQVAPDTPPPLPLRPENRARQNGLLQQWEQAGSPGRYPLRPAAPHLLRNARRPGALGAAAFLGAGASLATGYSYAPRPPQAGAPITRRPVPNRHLATALPAPRSFAPPPPPMRKLPPSYLQMNRPPFSPPPWQGKNDGYAHEIAARVRFDEESQMQAAIKASLADARAQGNLSAPPLPPGSEYHDADLQRALQDSRQEFLDDQRQQAAQLESRAARARLAQQASPEMTAAIEASLATHAEEMRRRSRQDENDPQLARAIAASLETAAPSGAIRINHAARTAYESIKDDASAYYRDMTLSAQPDSGHMTGNRAGQRVQTAQGVLHEMSNDRRDRLMSDLADNNRQTRAYFERRNLEAKETSDKENMCLPRALYKHASGNYDSEHTEACRRLLKKLGLREGDMLFASIHDPLYRKLVNAINEECGTSMDVHVIVSGPNGLPVFDDPRGEGEGTGKHPVVIWNTGAHFQPVIAR